ncbi:release factor glutamine methyltransferase [Marinobacter sp. LV10R510-11A]|uniref:peptide chain release factor N(5)-glutamine methyltransferase n=1 Tax=Marinobacter sp. LV10R510-11A TaxID=1415568 RepID=UPI000BB72CBA|nr:peptide chain release factor N(5)-glutamine methyltransferase [Marinobacter sp. LV10R510-11A]SOB76499.1 release factor glutamine methyltransferase [Marinobacter sp. LV10R510-11A]
MMSKPSLTCEALLGDAVRRIASDTPRLDAELLLAHVSSLSRSSFRAYPERELDSEQAAQFEGLVAQRVLGVPIAYLLGYQEFWSLPFIVSNSTLIPRPDTECLVEQALEIPLADNAKVLDLGTGTGAIALALASEQPNWLVTACDFQEEAITQAQTNARELQLPVNVFQSGWFTGLPADSFDLIVSNPPYIASGDYHLGEGDVRFEPASALVAGVDGLDDIRKIVDEAPAWLNSGGWLLLEHGFDQAKAVRDLFSGRGFTNVESRKDYGGNDRMTLGQWAPQGDDDAE